MIAWLIGVVCIFAIIIAIHYIIDKPILIIVIPVGIGIAVTVIYGFSIGAYNLGTYVLNLIGGML